MGRGDGHLGGKAVNQDLAASKSFFDAKSIYFSRGSQSVFIVTIVLFCLPCTLLAAAWRRYLRNPSDTPMPAWRAYCGVTALFLAGCATLLELVFFFSWFHNGGGPHGMLPPPGIWKVAGRIGFWAFVASIILTFFGKGRWRILVPAWAISLCVAELMILALEMD